LGSEKKTCTKRKENCLSFTKRKYVLKEKALPKRKSHKMSSPKRKPNTAKKNANFADTFP